MAHQAPARGVMEGIRQDLQRAKEGKGFDPNGVGNAYSHNFLNQKPWHPANFRNQARVFEAQQKQAEDAKRKEMAKADFQAEQEYLQTLSFLSPEEQEKYKERQGVQFLYMKPPGADSMPAAASKGGEKPGGASAPGGPPQGAPDQQSVEGPLSRRKGQKSHVSDMLGAVRALQNHEKWDVTHLAGIGRSPPRGAADVDADNQRILVSSSDDHDSEQEAQEVGRRRKCTSEDELAEAEAVLRKAGYDVDQLRKRPKLEKGKKLKSKKTKKDKKRHRQKE